VNIVVNGEARTIAVEPRMTLLDALREELGLRGTKKGCDRGECSACTVHVDGRRVVSCMALAVMQEGRRITTIEGLERNGQLHPLQLAFVEHDGFQSGASLDDVRVTDGGLLLTKNAVSITYADVLARNGLAMLVDEADYDPIEEAKGPKAIFSFSAVFAEVRVDPDLGVVRLNRFVGAYDAGRIINPKTARSQAIGGIIWGVGQALLEQSETDPTTGRFVNRNYSGYLVPTNADIPPLDVLFVGEFDAEASPLSSKGLGELTAVSVAPAIANAVYHATGKRIRDLPISVEKLL
jgi:xanthine dehydrogenase YagR molybdenum-binding subunit